MNKTQEALRMAIEYLEYSVDVVKDIEGYNHKVILPVIKTCKEALAECEQAEPATIVTQIDAVKFQEALNAMCVDKDAKIAELQAHINELREALEQTPTATGFIRTLENIDKNGIETWKLEPFFTLAELQAHDDEVIERCAKVVEGMIEYASVIDAVRALKEQPQ